MSSESLHAPRDRLSRATITYHQAVVSLIEELEATDWYRQRADDCEDGPLKEILLHNMREEIEHACMILEWLRRNDAAWSKQLDTYLYTSAPITEVEEAAETGGGGAEGEAKEGEAPGTPKPRFTVGDLKKG
jgi:ferritin-like protein